LCLRVTAFPLFRLGDYVIVGIYNDQVENERKGMNFPIMNLQERVLSVLGCKVKHLLISSLSVPYLVSLYFLSFLLVCG
jgi:ethanolamine-phosphate cytidylyltransferase